MKVLQRIDYFRKVPNEYSRSSILGALFSLLTIFAVLYIGAHAISDMSPETIHKQIYARNDKKDDYVKVNLKIVFLHMPCIAMTLSSEDMMGHYSQDIKSVKFTRVRSTDGGYYPIDTYYAVSYTHLTLPTKRIV